jgi:hypothetical protein
VWRSGDVAAPVLTLGGLDRFYPWKGHPEPQNMCKIMGRVGWWHVFVFFKFFAHVNLLAPEFYI